MVFIFKKVQASFEIFYRLFDGDWRVNEFLFHFQIFFCTINPSENIFVSGILTEFKRGRERNREVGSKKNISGSETFG